MAFGKKGLWASPRDEATQPSETQRARRLSRITAIAVAVAVAGAGFGIWCAVDANVKVAAGNAGREPVLVTLNTINKGEVVEASDVGVINVPAALRAEGSLGEDAAGEIVGKVASMTLTAGSQLTSYSVVGKKNTATLADALEPGTEAVTISVDAQTGLAGLLKVDDVVRVVLTQTTMDSGAVATDVAAMARIVALDNILSGGGDYASVTLEVTPVEATAIREAQAVGTVSIVLEAAAREVQTS